MIAVIFEVQPYPECCEDSSAIAAALAEDLRQVDGFLSAERFRSLTQPERLLSLSYWRDEAAVAAWRDHVPHRNAQHRGKHALFRAWHIRIAHVLRETLGAGA
jgi:heme-degrading monooxygenase HmoA